MIKEAIEKVLELAIPQLLEIDGRPYTSKGIHPVLDPIPQPICLGTLTSLVEYIRNGIDDYLSDLANVMLLVESPVSVSLVSPVNGKFHQRFTLAQASCGYSSMAFGQYMDMETFNVSVQRFFVQDDETSRIYAITGNITKEASLNLEDDGVTQRTTVRAGITRVGNVAIANPFILRHFSTFTEIDQPEKAFIFRLQGSGESMRAALFQVDNGQAEAISKREIKRWLAVELGEEAVILA